MEARTNARVAVLTGLDRFEIENRDFSERPDAGMAVVRVRECGICGSDLKMAGGKHPILRPPLVLGHEFYGTVEALGAGQAPAGVAVGSEIVVFPPVGCGACYNCRRTRPYLCAEMRFVGGQLAGALADYVVAPMANLIPIDAAVPPEVRVLIEPLAVAVHAVNRGAVAAAERAVVIGAGPIGLFTALVLRHRAPDGRAPAVIDRVGERLELARTFGLADVIDARGENVPEAVRAHGRREGADVAFECVGSAAVAEQALELTCNGGRVVLVGIQPRELAIDGVLLQRGERSLIGVQMYDRDDFKTAMSMLADGIIPAALVPSLVRSFALEEIAAAFDVLRRGSVFKAVVRLSA